MVLKYKDQEITSLADIQRLTAKDLRIIFYSSHTQFRETKIGMFFGKDISTLLYAIELKRQVLVVLYHSCAMTYFEVGTMLHS